MKFLYFFEKFSRHLWNPVWLIFTHNYLLIVLLAIATCFVALLLAGCSSSRPGLPNIYLTALSYDHPATGNNSVVSSSLNSTFSGLVGNASMTVRAGYFGICIKSSNQDWVCHKDATSFAKIINATQDPLDLISKSIVFRHSIIFSGLLYARSPQHETGVFNGA